MRILQRALPRMLRCRWRWGVQTWVLLLFAATCCAAAASIPLDIPEGLLGAPTKVPAGTSVPSTALAVPGIGAGSVLASYDPALWTGDLRRFDGDGRLLWSAAAVLPAPDERKLFTSARRVDGSTYPVEMRTAALPADLQRLLPAATLAAIRDRPLGAIVHSAPAFAGAPAPTISGQSYFDFLTRLRDRPATVYVAADDGLLHAFDAATGVERFAYMPPALLPRVAAARQLTRGLMDGTPLVAEAQAGTVWRTVLATGYGMGERGLFALDASDPAAFGSGGGELLAFGAADDRGIGYLMTAPSIARIRVGTADGMPQYRWFVITASGINGEGAPALFLLALDKPVRTAWRLNTNYYRLDVADATGPLTAPGLTVGPDGAVLYAYCGDLAGNVWRFDFTGRPPWRSSVSRLFVARDGTGVRQPITAAPAVAHALGGGYIALFGTGKWMETEDTDPANFAPQTLYAVRDSLARPVHAISGRAQLAQRQLRPGSGGLVLTGRAVDPSRSDGWFIDLLDAAQTGERTAAPPLLRDGVAIFTTLLPPLGMAGGGPASRVYALDVLSGMPPAVLGEQPAVGQRIATPSVLPPLLIATAAQTGASEGAGRVPAWRTWSVVTAGAPQAGAPQIRTAFPARRLSWREIANWQERHEAVIEEEHRP
jgi:type IV pilus assembly protein PilY1